MKYIHNKTIVEKTYFSAGIAAGEFFLIPKNLESEYAIMPDLISDVTNNIVALSVDGISDLSPTVGLALLTATGSGTESYFDNTTNGFAATNCQSAIEEAKGTLTRTSVTGTSTLTTTSTNFATLSSMTITPSAGTYLVLFSGNFDINGVNGNGQISIFSNGTQQSHSNRNMLIETAILGLITLSTNRTGGSLSTMAEVTLSGSQAIEIKYRSVDGQTFRNTARSLTIIRIA